MSLPSARRSAAALRAIAQPVPGADRPRHNRDGRAGSQIGDRRSGRGHAWEHDRLPGWCGFRWRNPHRGGCTTCCWNGWRQVRWLVARPGVVGRYYRFWSEAISDIRPGHTNSFLSTRRHAVRSRASIRRSLGWLRGRCAGGAADMPPPHGWQRRSGDADLVVGRAARGCAAPWV